MENCTIEFWEHQKIMFLKCKMIEEKYNLGILADNPGSGKTLVSLALISSTIKESRKEKKPNIIVVAENIYYQWIDNIEKFKNLSYKKFVDYQDISYLYFNMSDLLNYDILLTTPLYYNIIVQNINNIGKDCYRLVIDEIDSVTNILREKINSKKTWYISGTFSFDKIKNLNINYYFGINEENKSNIICKLDEEDYFPINNLLEPTYEIIKCKNIYLDNILSQFKDDIFTNEEIEKLNGLDIEGFTALAGLNQNIMDLRMITHQFITKQKKIRDQNIKNIENNKKQIEDYIFNLRILESKENLSNEEIDELHIIRNTLTSLSGVEKDLEDKVKSASSKYDKIINRIKEEGMCMVCYEEKNNNFITTGCCNSIYCSKCIISCLRERSICPFCRTNLIKEKKITNPNEEESIDDINYFLKRYNIFHIKNDNETDIMEELYLIDYNDAKEKIYNKIINKSNNLKDFSDIDNITFTDLNLNINKEDISKIYNEIKNDILKKINNDIESLKEKNRLNMEKEIVIENKLINNKIKEEKLINDIQKEKDKLIEYSKKSKNYKSKIDELYFLLDTTSIEDKLIIFSNHTRIFNSITKYLKEKNKQFIEIDTLDSELISFQLNKFKNDKNCNILLADSSFHSAGLNLEFTDIIIIMHKIEEDVKKQLIARAQRPGRTEQLEIYQLLHLNECMEKLI